MSNCYLYAFGRLWRRGGHVVLTRSRYGWWLHATWTPDFKLFYSYDPWGRKRQRWFPPVLFRGHVRCFKHDRSV